MKIRILLLTALFSLLALAVACGNAPANSNNAVKPANSPANVAVVTTNPMPNSSMANKPANSASNATAANKPPTSMAKTNAADVDEPMNKIATTKKPPKGATAVCKDGTYSFSKTDS